VQEVQHKSQGPEYKNNPGQSAVQKVQCKKIPVCKKEIK